MNPSVAVVVRIGRPHRPALFVPSLAISLAGGVRNGYWSLLAMCETPEDARVRRQAGADVQLGTWHTWPEKCNAAVGFTDSDWLFYVGDDVRFECGWLDEALRVAAETGAQVISTNDCHNPFVMAGQRGTHLLVSSDYIVNHGATLDGPGTVFSEAYHHESDIETAMVAQARGVWAYAPDSVVEHLHVTWGLAEDDDTYREGRRWRMKDHQTWMRRQATMAERLAELDGTQTP